MNAADRGAGILVGGGGYGAGVEDNDSGLGGFVGAVQALLPELALDGCAVRLGGAASEIFHVEGSQASILACPMWGRTWLCTSVEFAFDEGLELLLGHEAWNLFESAKQSQAAADQCVHREAEISTRSMAQARGTNGRSTIARTKPLAD